MKTLIKLTVVMLMFIISTATAQKKDYSNEPGYVDFGNIAQFETDEMVTEVILEEHLLKMVSKITKGEDEELSSLINGLKLIKVNVFEVNEADEEQITDKITSIDSKLMDNGWDRIVKSRSKKESAYVYIKTDNSDQIFGLVVMAKEKSGEAAFVNIVGNINLEAIGKLSEKFDIPSLGHIKNDDKDKK